MTAVTYPKGYFEEGYTLENPFMTKGKREAFQSSINPDDYDTPLSAEEQIQYDNWVKSMQAEGKLAPGNEKFDYDMQGFWKNEVVKQTAAGQSGSAETHFTDTYKKPNHRTFSEESQYYNKDNKKYAGNWDKWNKANNQPTYKETQSLLTGGQQ